MSSRVTVSEFRMVFLLFCLDRMPDGSYVALNRRYKPVGWAGTEWVNYEDFPIGFKFKRALSGMQIAALSCEGDTCPQRIQIYNEGCIPTSSAAHWAAYAKRLQRLAGGEAAGQWRDLFESNAKAAEQGVVVATLAKRQAGVIKAQHLGQGVAAQAV